MAETNLARLHKAIAAVAPIYGVSVGSFTDKTTWTVSYNGASAPEIAAANIVIANYDGIANTDNTVLVGLSRLAANAVTTSNTHANVGTLGFAIGAYEVWSGEFYLSCTGSTDGMKFQLTGPSSPASVRISVNGHSTAITAITFSELTAFSSASTAFIVNGTPFTGRVKIEIVVENGPNAGTVQLQFASATNAQTNTILKNSYRTARMVGIADRSQLFAANGTFTVPAGVTSITIEGWGSGGNGAAGDGVTNGGAGGGAGAYVINVPITVAPSDNYSVTIGADSTVTNPSLATVLLAKGGTAAVNQTPGTGGSASACTGDTKISGEDGQANSVADGGRGGNSHNGAGGVGGTSGSQAGGVGTLPGGGAGGAYKTGIGSAIGGAGQVRFTW